MFKPKSLKLLLGLTLGIFSLFIFLAHPNQAFAGSCSSNGVGTSWGTAANWTGTCTGAGGIPGTGDDVTISSGDPITLSVSTPVLNSITVNATLTGAGFTLNTATMTIGASGGLTGSGAPGAFSINLSGTSGTLFTNSGTIGAKPNFTLSGNGNAIFNSNSGTITTGSITVTGTGTKTLGASINISGGITVNTGATFDTSTNNYAITGVSSTSTNSLTVNGGTLNLNNSTVNLIIHSANNLIAVSGGGTLNAGTSTIILQDGSLSSSSLSLVSGTMTLYNLEILNAQNFTGIYNLSSVAQTLTISNNFTVDATTSLSVLTVSLGQTNNTINTIIGGITLIETSSSGAATLDASGTQNTGDIENLSTGSLDIESGGTFLARSSTVPLTGTSGTLFTLNSGTFTAGTSTINMTGNGSATINSGSPTFYNLTSSGTGTKTLGIGITLASGGTLSVTNGTFDPATFAITNSGSNTLSVSNAQINVGASTFAGNYGTPTVNLGVGSTVNYNNGAQTVDHTQSYVNLSFSGGTASLNGTTTATGALTINNGSTLDTNSSSNYTLNAGSFIIGASGAINCNASTINVTGTSGTLVNTGASGNGINYGTSTFTFSGNGSAQLDGSAQANFYNVTISGTGTKTIGSSGLVINTGGTLSVTNGILDPGSNTIVAASSTTLSVSNAQINVGASSFTGSYSGFTTITLGSGSTVNYDGGSSTIDHTLSYVNLSILGGGNFSLDGSTPVSGTLTIGSSATLNPSPFNYGISVAGNWVNNGGFTPRSGTVTLNGTTTQTVTGTNTFYNLTITNAGREIDFPASTITTVSNAFNAIGTLGNVIKLFSSTPGTQWTLNTPSASVSYVNVKDATCSTNAPNYVTQTNLTNSGNNGQCWVDTIAPTTPGTPTYNILPSQVVLSWSPSTDASSGVASYAIQYSTDPTFTTNVTTQTVSSPTYSITLPQGTYYARVDATDIASNTSSYSPSTTSFYFAPTTGGAPLYKPTVTVTPVGTPILPSSGSVTPGLPITGTPTLGLSVNISSTSGCTATTLYSPTTGMKCPLPSSGSATATTTTLLASCSITSHLAVGSKGTEVKCLQTLLNLKPVDGIFGKGTKAAVMVFQKMHDLTQDGVVGPEVRKALLN